MQPSLSAFRVELEISTTGSKSLWVLLAAGKVKVMKAHHSYIEKCCDIYHSIIF
jgi:hypothetical protein